MDDLTSRPGAPTISQVAEAAGVSRATVSRAFTRPDMLSADTVRRVMAIAKKIGYVPNHTARALSTGRYGNVALVVPDVANPFFPPLIRAAQVEAEKLDFCVFLGNSDENPAQEEKLVSRFATQVEGFILASSRLSDERIRFQAARRPLVLINRDIKGIPTALVVNKDNKVEQRQLVANRTAGAFWLVEKGLNEGDRVITEGLQYVKPGAQVTVKDAGNLTEAQSAPAAGEGK